MKLVTTILIFVYVSEAARRLRLEDLAKTKYSTNYRQSKAIQMKKPAFRNTIASAKKSSRLGKILKLVMQKNRKIFVKPVKSSDLCKIRVFSLTNTWTEPKKSYFRSPFSPPLQNITQKSDCLPPIKVVENPIVSKRRSKCFPLSAKLEWWQANFSLRLYWEGIAW